MKTLLVTKTILDSSLVMIISRRTFVLQVVPPSMISPNTPLSTCIALWAVVEMMISKTLSTTRRPITKWWTNVPLLRKLEHSTNASFKKLRNARRKSSRTAEKTSNNQIMNCLKFCFFSTKQYIDGVLGFWGFGVLEPAYCGSAY